MRSRIACSSVPSRSMSSAVRCSVDGVMWAVLAPGRPGPVGVFASLMRVMCSGMVVSSAVTGPPGESGGKGERPSGPLLISYRR
jgi:hypothetical protein